MSHNTTEEILIRISQQVETIQKQLDEIKKQAELGLKEYFTMGEFAQFGGIPIDAASGQKAFLKQVSEGIITPVYDKLIEAKQS